MKKILFNIVAFLFLMVASLQSFAWQWSDHASELSGILERVEETPKRVDDIKAYLESRGLSPESADGNNKTLWNYIKETRIFSEKLRKALATSYSQVTCHPPKPEGKGEYTRIRRADEPVQCPAVILTQSSSQPRWVPISQISPEDRMARLGRLYFEANFRFIPGIHTTTLPGNSGRAFAYDGPIEAYFLDHLATRTDNVRVLVPAAGVGRTIMDILSTNQARVVANDLNEDAQRHFDNLSRSFQVSDTPRHPVEWRMGDILEVLDTLEDNSFDYVYISNLIHFFSEQQLKTLLKKLHRVLKPGGMLYLTWRSGTITARTNLQYETGARGRIAKLIESRTQAGHRFPYYLTESDQDISPSFRAELRQLRYILPYSYVSIEAVFRLAVQAHFAGHMQSEGQLAIAAWMNKIALGDYDLIPLQSEKIETITSHGLVLIKK